MRKFQSWKNMLLKIWLPWKYQVPSLMTCSTKLFPDKLYKYSLTVRVLLLPNWALPPPLLNRITWYYDPTFTP